MGFKSKFLLDNDETYFIAEIGINHNGVISLAKKMIKKSSDIGAHAVKFQKRDPKMLLLEGVQVPNPTGYLSKSETDFPTEEKAFGSWDYPDIRLEFTNDQHLELWKYAKSLNLDYIISPWDENSLNFLVKNNAKVIKIASIDTNNFSFMELVAQKQIPVIASIGMCNWNEVAITWNIFKKAKCPIMFLHCTSAYPCPIEDKNLNCIPILQNMFKEDIGFSGHGTGPIGTLGAVALGAKVIEKHVTLSRKMSGPDQNASLEFNELKDLIINSNEMRKALGSSIKAFEKSEKTLHGVLAKRIIISKPMKSGEKITASHIRTVVTKKNDGLLPNKYYEILGFKVKNDLKINHVLEFSDLI